MELGRTFPRCPPWLRAWWQTYSDCGLQTCAGFVIELSLFAHWFGNSN